MEEDEDFEGGGDKHRKKKANGSLDIEAEIDNGDEEDDEGERMVFSFEFRDFGS